MYNNLFSSGLQSIINISRISEKAVMLRLVRLVLIFKLLLLVCWDVICGTMIYHVPEFMDTPNNVTFFRGERARLECSVKNLGPKEVIWKRLDQKHPLTVGKLVFVDDKSFDIKHRDFSPEWTLVINNVQLIHAGLYECQISTQEVSNRVIQLNVRDPGESQNNAISISGKNFVDKGNPIILLCNATGEHRPPLDIDWFKDGMKLKSDSTKGIGITTSHDRELKTFYSELEIEKSKMEDAGNYICRSSDLLVTSAHVTVLNADRISIKRGTSAGTSSQAGYSFTKSARCESETVVHILLIISVLFIYNFKWYS